MHTLTLDFIQLYLKDFQENSPDISATAARAGDGDRCCWQPLHRQPGAVLPVLADLDRTSRRAAPATLHGCLRSAVSVGCFFGLVFFPPQSTVFCCFHEQFLSDLHCPPQWYPQTCAGKGEVGRAMEQGVSSSFQRCRLGLPGSSASLPRWPRYF